MKKTILLKLFALVAAMMCAQGVQAQEAYACFTPSDSTMTFYYDNLRSTRTNTYSLNTGYADPAWYLFGSTNYPYAKTATVVFDPSFAGARPTTTCNWFLGMNKLKTIIGMNYLNTSSVTNMTGMFQGCSALTNIDVSGFNTANVTDMMFMFSSCSGLTSISLSGFDVSNVTNFMYMFAYCPNLTTIYVSDLWRTSADATGPSMFYNSTSLVGGMGTTYDANHIDMTYAHIDGGPSNPGYFSDDPNGPHAYACYTAGNTTLTFYCDNLRNSRPGTTYDLNTGTNAPEWYTDNTYSSVTQVVFDPSFAGARPTSAYRWFYYMQNLQAITGMTEYLNTEEVTSMYGMFYNCIALTSLDLSSFNTEKVTSMQSMFMYCSGLTTLDLRSFNTEKVTNMQYMFGFSPGLTSLDLSSFNTEKVSHMYGMFSECRNLVTIYVSSAWKTGAVSTSGIGGKYMFKNCTSLVGGKGTTYDAEHEDVTYAHIDGGYDYPGYFTDRYAAPEPYACFTADNTTLTFYYDNQRRVRPGTTYNLNDESSPDWATTISSSVTQVVFDPSFADARPISTIFWFYSMSNLTTITGMTEYLNTSNVINMDLMFSGCSSLTSIDLSNFNTANVISMESMFAGCTSLTTLNLSSFNTSKVTDMFRMFYNCSSLTSLDLSHFNTSKVSNMEEMFYNCSNLTTIYAGEGWSTAAVTSSSYMFHGCRSLVGGAGTTYNVNCVDATYAHIDGGPSNPGYFTAEGAQPWTLPEPYACFTADNTTLTFYYDNQRSTRPGTTYDLNTGSNAPEWYTDNTCSSVTQVVFDPSFAAARPTSAYRWFYNMKNLQAITGMTEYLNTEEVTSMYGMFYYCRALTSLDLSGFNTGKVTNMLSMFMYCSGLTTLDLSSFNTEKVTSMQYMFGFSPGLTSLDLSSFNTEKVSNMYGMFYQCTNLVTIYVGSDWNTGAVSTSGNGGKYLFKNCTSLVGGMGTAYDAEHEDVTYAHIDGGPSNPGYFTAQGAQPWTEPEPEAYACYTSSDSTLTFYYDTQRSVRPGTTYDLNEGEGLPGWYLDYTYPSVTRVVFDSSFGSARPTSTSRWFHSMGNLQSISGMSYLNTANVTTMSFMFSGCTGLTSLDLTGFNTSNVTSMGYMFGGCSGLMSLDVSSFNTSNVNSMEGMFSSCSSLTSLDLSGFNTSNVIEMSYMFRLCSNLVTIYAGSGWSTAAVDFSDEMFKGSTRLVGGAGTTYDVNHVDATYAHIDGGPSNPGYFTAEGAQPWTEPEAYACFTVDNTTLTFYYDTERSTRTGTTYDMNTGSNDPGWCTDNTKYNVFQVVFDPSFANARPTSTFDWFEEMQNLESITGLSYLNTSEVTNMAYMFSNCYRITSLDLSHFNTSKVTSMLGMFYNCKWLTSLDLSNFNTGNVTNMSGMFINCTGLTSLDLSSFNTSQVTIMSGMFAYCNKLQTIYVGSAWSTAAVADSNNMFYNCTSLVGGMGTTYDANHVDVTYAHIDGGPSNPGYFTDPNAVLEAYACYTADNTTLTFYYDNQRSSRTGTTYDLNTGSNDPGWYTDNICSSVTQVVFDASFANARPTSAYRWFSDMLRLQAITGMTEYLNTEEVTSMYCMFYYCKALTSLDLSSFNTEKVTSMQSMFMYCSGLTTLDLSSFNTEKVTSMQYMFGFSPGLTSLDLSSFNPKKVSNMYGMFYQCRNLATIYVGSDWNTGSVSASTTSGKYLFYNCTSLVGGMGTTYDANHTDVTYAHIDGGPSNPGYLTAKVDAPRGDVNGDTFIDINDVTLLIDVVLGKPATYNAAAADCNIEGGDGAIDINDVTTLINRVLTGNW